MRYWHYVKNGVQTGPVTEEALISLLQSDGLSRSTFVWNQDMKEWTKASDVGALLPVSLTDRPTSLATQRFRIGNYEWCEPDYRQVLMWAEALHMEPETVIERLLAEPPTKWNHQIYTQFKNGRIVSLHLSIRLLPLKAIEWVEGLVIEASAFTWDAQIGETLSLSLPLPKLRRLHCENVLLTKLDLSAVPQLAELRCYDTKLTGLDLSSVPQLTKLWCAKNQLTQLDLSRVPLLTELKCGMNQLTELDLSAVPELTKLDCGMNQLTELDLSGVSRLTELDCGMNRLTELDLLHVPLLMKVDCQVNQLTELDLSATPSLTELRCGSNHLTQLDLSGVPLVTELMCHENQLTELALSGVPRLTLLFCYNNQLKELNLRAVPKLTDLVIWFRASSKTRYRNSITKLDIRGQETLWRVAYDASETCLTQRTDQSF